MKITYRHNGIQQWTREQKTPLRVSSGARKEMEEQGRAAWGEIHSAAVAGLLTEAWLDTWEGLIPRYGCTCVAEWKKIRKANPLPVDKAEHPQWTIDRHNDINRKLGKPIWLENPAG